MSREQSQALACCSEECSHKTGGKFRLEEPTGAHSPGSLLACREVGPGCLWPHPAQSGFVLLWEEALSHLSTHKHLCTPQSSV